MIKNILFDFDGVILNSMPIRDYGFRKIFEKFDNDLIGKLLIYHNKNGGLSRYVKIKYFYNELLDKEISEKEINDYAALFSEIMKKELIKKQYLIVSTLVFIQGICKKYNLHIVSGSDEKELRFLCQKLNISYYFKSIHGSPMHKNLLVKNILKNNRYAVKETVLIGDSINDYEAARINKVTFFGFNNVELAKMSDKYIVNYNNIF
jgi:phosphoglycolate phosphatase-like HAD superfamily hydrolase